MNMKMFKGVIAAALIFIIYQKDLNSYTVEEIVYEIIPELIVVE